ncbi:MAG: Ig-like domain-containing protein, partial [bacterium]|nr:Ig-like domain-containing protein [bacterium]
MKQADIEITITSLKNRGLILLGLVVLFIGAATGMPQAAPKIMPLGNSITHGYLDDGCDTCIYEREGYRRFLDELIDPGYGTPAKIINFVGSVKTGLKDWSDSAHCGYPGSTADELITGIESPWIVDPYNKHNPPTHAPLANLLTAHTPDIILLHIGTNDIYWNDTMPTGNVVASTSQDINRIISIIYNYRATTRIFVAGIIPVVQGVVSNPAEFNAKVVDLNDSISQLVSDWAGDTGALITYINHYSQFAGHPEYMSSGGVHPNTTGYQVMANTWDAAIHDIALPLQIIATSPYNYEGSVPLLANIEVHFSKSVNTTNVACNLSPNPTGVILEASWNPDRTIVTYTHATPFDGNRTYTCAITGVKDDYGYPLDGANSWQFTTLTPLRIVATSPANGATGVGLRQPIIVTFSRPMATVTWADTAPYGWSSVPTWNGDKTQATFSHSNPFQESTVYGFQITGGTGANGQPLDPPLVPNPWSFTTITIYPQITFTSPFNGELDVAWNKPVVVTFSERMNRDTVQYQITPDPNPGNWTVGWNATDSQATFSHPTDFAESQGYTFRITAGQDLDGHSLAAGPAANPWNFRTKAVPPEVVATNPQDGANTVALNQPIIVTFSEPMNTSTVNITITPALSLTKSWNASETEATYNHSGFNEDTTYFIKVEGNDQSGIPMSPVYTFGFTTINPSPYLISVAPLPGAPDVLLNQPVVVTFSEPMDTTTVDLNVVAGHDPGGWTEEWNGTGTRVTYSHSFFEQGRNYTLRITGQDLAGQGLLANPALNPWSFTTSSSPFVIMTIPDTGATGVPIDQPIIIVFSELMSHPTFQYECSPTNPFSLTIWETSDTDQVTLSHLDVPFEENTTYTFRILAIKDSDNQPLLPLPYPITFTTGQAAPTIVSTIPVNGATGVSRNQNLIITFSEAMDTGSLQFTSAPNPGGWTREWNSADSQVILRHADFAESTAYIFTITAGKDLSGLPLATLPYSINFTTVGTAPTIVSTIPVNGATGVSRNQNLIITFSEAMNTASLAFTSNPDPGGWTREWNSADSQVILRHADFAESTAY